MILGFVRHVGFVPFAGNDLEAVGGGVLAGRFGGFFGGRWVDTVGELLFGLFALGAGIGKTDSRIFANCQGFLLAGEAVGQPP